MIFLFYILKVLIFFVQFCIYVPPGKSFVKSLTQCSREQSSIVRQILHKVWKPIFLEYGVKLPKECPLHFSRDVFKFQELAKLHYRVNIWTCGFCGKSFFLERLLDSHMANTHSDKLFHSEESVCLADYCDVFQCKDSALDLKYVLNDTKPVENIKALTVGPPYELALLLNAGEKERNNEEPLSRINSIYNTLSSGFPKRRKRLFTEQNHSSEEKFRDAFEDYSKKHKSETKSFLYHQSSEEDDQPDILDKKIDDQCDPILMKRAQERCQQLVHVCVLPLLAQLTDEDYKALYYYLDKRICWYLTCERCSQFLASLQQSYSIWIFLIVGSVFIVSLLLLYYIIWFCF